MDAAKENKVFLISLWTFLISAIVVFFIYISTGRILLPPSLWASLVLINAGFIVFLFVPLHGRQKLGGRKEPRRREWYPRDIGEIVERPDSADESRPGMLRPGRAVDPVPLLPLLILLIVIVLSAPFGRGEEAWTHKETDRLTGIYVEAEAKLADLERRLGEVCKETGVVCRSIQDLGGGERQECGHSRIRLMHAIDSLASAASEGIEPVGELGIQVFSSDGERMIWGGTPRYAGRIETGSEETRVFIARTRLFTLLVRDMSLEDGRRVVADLPLAVNYRISNRFLRSTSLGEMIGARYGADVEFSYWMGRRMSQAVEEDAAGGPESSTTSDGAVRVRGLVGSSTGPPLGRLAVMGDTYASASSNMSSRRATWASLLLTLCVVVIARWIYNRHGKGRRPGENRHRGFVRRAAILTFFLVVIRYLMLQLDMPAGIFGVDLFDPALFADETPGGLMRNAGDFLISGAFLLVFVFGTVKSFRSYYGGRLERPVTGSGGFGFVRTIVRAVVLWAVLAGAAFASAELVSRTVLNANPRLIGLDAQFFSIPALTLHAAMLYSVAAIFIAAVFFIRLAMSWGGGRKGEILLSAAIAIIALMILPNPHWSTLAASAGLLLLSARVFPMLRREELLSVVFASFFLVVICSVVIFGVGAKEYDELRRGKVMEAVEKINNPEDTWFQIVLPDMMEEISEDRSLVSRVMSHSQSAAFEIWARSVLSEFGSPCVFEVYDVSGVRYSRFSVGIPFEIAGALGDPGAGEEEIAPGVVRTARDSDYGRVFYFVGTTDISHPNGRTAGKVTVKLPYHYENPLMLTSAGPTAPEILRNVERGSVAPRIDEPEKLLVARVADGAVVDSSDPSMRPGTPVPAGEGEWFVHDSGDGKYNCIFTPGRGVSQYIAGYLIPGFNSSMLVWATIISVQILLTVISLVVLLLLRKLPVFGSVTPDVSLRGGLGFRRKLLLSFTAVSMIPVLLMGVFSSRYIRYRYRAVSETEAHEAAASAGALVRHGVRAEAEAFSRSRLLSDLLQSGEGAVEIGAPGYGESVFTLIDGAGQVVLGDDELPTGAIDPAAMRNEAISGRVTVTWTKSGLYAGTVIPFTLPQRGKSSMSFLYYRRKLDDGLIGRTASVLGRNLNVYYKGMLQASSERELFIGGFLGKLLAPSTYANVALGGSRTFITNESLGDYSYQVSSVGIPPLLPGESAVLSVPLLYRTAIIQSEVIRTSAVLLGLLALILCVAVTLGVFLAGRIFNPISDLRMGTRRIMRGDLEFRLESPATDEIGDLVTSFNSMTEALRTARRNVLERQRYLAAVLDNIATGVISAGSDDTIVTLNPAGERILGVHREDLLGKKPLAAGVPGLDAFFALFEGDTGGVVEKEIMLEHDGDMRTLKTVVAGLAEGGERLGTVVVFDDLTELIRSKKLSAWIEMARQIAHEVKNPLTPIKLSAQLMRRAYDAGSEEFGDIFSSGIETVIQQTEILRQIASEFSSFGRTVDLKRERLELAGFIEEVISGYKGAEKVSVEYTGGEGAALADREALRKILVNLIENSLEAIQGGGTITIDHEVSGGMARIRVIDTGAGLSGEAETKLFEPYFSTKTNGTGLGLAICQSLAGEMDGEIVLRNREGAGGVEAIVTLPASEQ